MAANREDVIWAAGLFEGEGCIRSEVIPSGKSYPRLRIKMTDRDTIQRFADIFNLKVTNVKKDKSWKIHWKDAFIAEAYGKNAYAILVMMFPWLGERRKQKTEEVIKSWATSTRCKPFYDNRNLPDWPVHFNVAN